MPGALANTSLQPFTRSVTAETCGPFWMMTSPLPPSLSTMYWQAICPAWTLLVCTVASAPAAATSTATTTTIVLLALLGSAAFPHVAHAQHVEGASTIVVPMSAFEREIQNEIVCMCGTCGRKRIDECTCGKAEEMRIEVAGLVKKGYTRDQVLDYYVQKYGSQEPLAMPIDKGFNRLAWAVPYALGVFGAVLAGTAAVRWTRRQPQVDAAPEAETAQSEAWQKKLDEELRDLD
jgi:cytochrome c-type biogenesis protein CcmH/NrfF